MQSETKGQLVGGKGAEKFVDGKSESMPTINNTTESANTLSKLTVFTSNNTINQNQNVNMDSKRKAGNLVQDGNKIKEDIENHTYNNNNSNISNNNNIGNNGNTNQKQSGKQFINTSSFALLDSLRAKQMVMAQHHLEYDAMIQDLWGVLSDENSTGNGKDEQGKQQQTRQQRLERNRTHVLETEKKVMELASELAEFSESMRNLQDIVEFPQGRPSKKP